MSIKIIKRGKIWHYVGTVAGRRLRGSTGATDKEIAKRIAAEKEARAWSGHLDGPGAGLTMAQAFLAYLDAEKSPRFIDRIADHWRNTPVATVTAGAIRQSAIKLYPNAGPATRNRHVIVPTQAALNHAAALYGMPSIKVPRFKIETKEKLYVTGEWVNAFEDHASPHLGALCRFMFETGARIGETTALTWADIDLDRRTALIRQTKVSVERTARITPRVLVALANIPSNRNPGDPVFQYASRESVRKSWDAVIARAGIAKLSPHACRHGFATAMLRAGVDVKTVAKWGGWQDVRTLVETYAHAITDPSVVDAVFDTELTQAGKPQPLTYGKKREI